MDRVTIDFLFLARHAEAANGLLNVIGGACTDVHRAMPLDRGVPLSHFGIALSISVPWMETNKPHRLVVRIVNEDETQTIVHAGTHHFSVGRPPTMPPGTAQHVVLGMGADVIFPQAGGYCVIAELDTDTDVRKWPFRVHDVHPNVLVPVD